MGDADAIKQRCSQNQTPMKQLRNSIKKNYWKDLQKLSGGVGVIKVGAATETEMKKRNSVWKMLWQQHGQPLKEGIIWAAVPHIHASKRLQSLPKRTFRR